MARIAQRLAAAGLVLPPRITPPPGTVASAPGFQRQPTVIDGFSDLILELFGPDVSAPTRSAVGMAELPFNIPVEIEGEVEID